MQQTFHQFSLLPLELREEIWRFAIRLHRAEVYFVSLYDGVEHRDLEDDQSRWLDPKDDESPPWRSQHWDIHESGASPAGRQGDTASEEQHAIPTSGRWTLSALSSNDSLWAVNKESRRIVESVSKGSRWDAFDLQLESPATPEAVHGESKGRVLTVFPRNDLFYLQPKSLQALPWERLDLSSPLDLSNTGFDRIHHVALDFDFAWSVELAKASQRDYYDMVGLDIIQTFVKAAFNARQDAKLWFVDHSLVWKPDVPTKERVSSPNAQVFCTGDQRFVDIVCDDDYCPWEGDYYEDDDGAFCHCRRFVRELEAIIETIYSNHVEYVIDTEYWDDCNDSRESTISGIIDDGVVRPPPRLSFGILARESR